MQNWFRECTYIPYNWPVLWIPVKLSCGGSTSHNNSYIVQSSATSVSSPCTYEVCPCSTDICRIRYDFTSFTIATQVVFTANAGAVTSPNFLEYEYATGDCTTDQFSISSPGYVGSPVICGTNTGQHSEIKFPEILQFPEIILYFSDPWYQWNWLS